MSFLTNVDINGQTPLHRAASKRQDECVRLLLQYGNAATLVAQVNRNGVTPLHSAAKRGHKACVELCINNGAGPNAKTNKGETALGLAYDGLRKRPQEGYNTEFSGTLLVHPKHVEVTNFDILDWAIEKEYYDLCRLLTKTLDRPNRDGWTLYLISKHLGLYDLVPLSKKQETHAMIKPTRRAKSDITPFALISDDGLEASCKTGRRAIRDVDAIMFLTFLQRILWILGTGKRTFRISSC